MEVEYNNYMKTIKSALVSIILTAVLAILTYIASVGDIFAINWRIVANIGILSLIPGAASLIKSYGTTEDGTFAGIKIK